MTKQMSKIELTATQAQVLQHALDHTDGRIDWFPESVKGGARRKVLDAMCSRALITRCGDGWRVAAQGCDALGVPRRDVLAVTPLAPAIEAAAPAIERQAREEPKTPAMTAAKTPRTRDNSKQATVIALLKRPDGASIPQICEATGWQSHTVRGTFAGTFKKRLGLAITSTKDQGAERIYKLT